jgi:adenylosuccinate synthase
MPNSKRFAHVVIGANFGDEGKGLLTDYYASKLPMEFGYSRCVVRYNGGAQAGHTVVTSDRRHIFSHFGSGTLTGAATFLARDFIVNPRFFLNERAALSNCGAGLVVDPSCHVSVPYDRLINELVEQARGVNRHGSVGVGINETVRRSEHTQYRLTVDGLRDSDYTYRKLEKIANEWVPKRLADLGFPDILSKSDRDILNCGHVRSRFTSDCRTFMGLALRNIPTGFRSKTQHVIFEGAQGLQLDPDYGVMPHVTPSHTGLKNVVPLAREMAIDELEVTYVTRCYLTRHGAGPLPFECSKPYPGIVDETNLPHTFQGELRFAPLNIDMLKEVITKDLKHAEGKIPVTVTLAVTCLDQVGDAPLHYVLDGQERSASIDDVLIRLEESLPLNKMLTASGPTRSNIRQAFPL